MNYIGGFFDFLLIFEPFERWHFFLAFREADHLSQLLAAMEAQPGQTEAAKVQIADLKQELAASQVPSYIPKYNPVQHL